MGKKLKEEVGYSERAPTRSSKLISVEHTLKGTYPGRLRNLQSAAGITRCAVGYCGWKIVLVIRLTHSL